MENRKIRSNRLDDDPRERKISRGLVRHVLTRNTSDRIALGKVTRQLDKERIAKELDYQHQKQKLLLQKFESQMKERSEKDTQELNKLDDSDTPQHLVEVRMAPGRAVLSRYRTYSDLDMSSLQLQGLKCPVESREALERKQKSEKGLHLRETIEREIKETDWPRMRKTGVINVTERPAIVKEGRMKRTRTLSDILPPVILPPIYKSSSSPLERRKNLEHQRIKAKEFVAESTGTSQTPAATEIHELEDCRYIRKSKFR